MCREHRSLRMLAAAMDGLDIEQETCLSASDVIENLASGRFSALVVDFDLPSAAQVARLARLVPPQKRPVVFALIGASTAIASAFQSGANFVLYKPLDEDHLLRSLRAARAFMRPDRRRARRERVETLVYMQFGVAALPAIVLDITEKGLAMQTGEPLPVTSDIPFRFVLPGTSNMIDGSGDVIWADDNGRVGMFFTGMNAGSRRHLKEWIAKHGRKKRDVHESSRPRERTAKTRAASASI
ncbi:MAG TPA: PilZ domain-containing protein [Terriglobales bacterium]